MTGQRNDGPFDPVAEGPHDLTGIEDQLSENVGRAHNSVDKCFDGEHGSRGVGGCSQSWPRFPLWTSALGAPCAHRGADVGAPVRQEVGLWGRVVVAAKP